MTPEFSRPRAVDTIPARGMAVRISADGAERQALAKRFKLRAIDLLEAEFTLRPVAGTPLVRVAGTVRGAVVQSCIISLEPVPASIEEEVEAEFGPVALDTVDVELTLEDADPPEPIVAGMIDLGEFAAQSLSLALDPFPRAPNAGLAQIPATEMGPGGLGWSVGDPVGPLAGLAKLKGRLGDADP